MISKVQKYKIFSELKKISDTNKQNLASRSVSGSFTDVGSQAAELLERLMPYSPDASRFTVLCRRDDYSAGRLARAIEDCNAHVINLNVTADSFGDDLLAVDVRVDRKNIDSIVRSLARYDYTVVGSEKPDDMITETERMRVAELLRYLDV